jgi:hypothetical protein
MNNERLQETVITGLTIDAFDEQALVRYLFTARTAHPSGGPALDFDHRKGDNRTVRESFEAAARSFGVEQSALFVMRQVHGDDIAVIRDFPDLSDLRARIEVDAAVTTLPGLVLSVLTADCLPILMVDTNRKVIAAVHAGWRGTVLGIAQKTVQTITEAFGSSPRDIAAALGPAIGRCCYEVGEEVVDEARRAFPFGGDFFETSGDGKAMMDLAGLNRRLLVDVGVGPDRIHSIDLCTRCHGELFYSYRREGAETGRMLAGIMLKG